MLIPRPVHCRPEAYDLFAAQMPVLGSTDALVTAAVAMAMHEMHDADPAEVDARLQDLADRIRARVRSDNRQALLAHAHDVLFEEEGFIGNAEDYYNPHNSYLPAVLRTKRGIPITLTLVYKAVLERLGFLVAGVNAPGHFLAALPPEDTAAGATTKAGGGGATGDEMLLVDPFFAGRTMTRDEAFERIEQIAGRPVPRTDELLAVASHRQWLARMLQNLQNIFGSTGRGADLAAMAELRGVLEGE
jgi:regulator of sirC expression with transglutaminase-like and TPR domain